MRSRTHCTLIGPRLRMRPRLRIRSRSRVRVRSRLRLRLPVFFIPGLLVRLRRPSVATSAWSISGNGEGGDHADVASGGLPQSRKNRNSSLFPREPGSVVVRNVSGGRVVGLAHLRTWHPAARPYPAFLGGSVKLALNGSAVLDHCSDSSGVIVGSSLKPNNVKGGNHGQPRSQNLVGGALMESGVGRGQRQGWRQGQRRRRQR
jgi:hypothetical protein